MQESGQGTYLLSQTVFSYFPCGTLHNFHLCGIIKKVKSFLTYFVDPDGNTPDIAKRDILQNRYK